MNKKPSLNVASGAGLDYQVLENITERAFYIALRMIDIANNRPMPDKGEPKVGGHPSACASSQHILAAIHLVLKNPADYMANKPHVSPMDHALNYLLHNFRYPNGELMADEDRKIAMRNLRHYSRQEEPVFQSYHAEVDPDGYRFFPSGSVGIPPVNALYTALGYNFAKDHGHSIDEDPQFWCLMGDSEFREGSLMEAMPDAGDRQLNRLIWIVDYNRQNLDGTRVLNEEAFEGSDADRIVRVAKANGWNAIKLEHGKKRLELFASSGGDELQRVLESEMTDFELQALIAANRPELTFEALSKKSKKLATWLKSVSKEKLHEAFLNLGGHDLESLIEVFQQAKDSASKPTLIVAYTVKGYRLQCQAMSGNHSTLPEAEELDEMGKKIGASLEDPFEEFAENSPEAKFLADRRAQLVDGITTLIENVENRKQAFYERSKQLSWPVDFDVTALKFNPVAHTQWMWGQIAAKLDRLAHGGLDESKTTEVEKQWGEVARYFLTMAPDVGTSTNTSPNMNGKLYGDIGQEDFEDTYKTKDVKAPDIVPNTSKRTGHLRFEIAEGNCMSAAGSFGKFFYFTGVPFFPAMTIYDFFIKRAHDQFYYNLYWHSHFLTVGTPSGVTLAAEGAQHSWKSDFQIPHCVTWEPCFAKELEWIFADMLRRHFIGDNVEREATLLRLVTKGIVQKEMLDRLKKQSRFNGAADADILSTIREDVLKGGYALVDYRDSADYVPGDNVVHLFAMGALVPEALKASDQLLEKGILANVFVVTSSDLLLGNFAEHDGYEHLREGLGINGNLYLNPSKENAVENRADWIAAEGSRIPIVSVHDGEPGLLDNIGSIVGTPQKALAIRKTSKSGTTVDIYHLHGIDAEAIVDASELMLRQMTREKLVVNPVLLTSNE